MKVISFSDPHGILPKIEEQFDLMLIGGDICPVDNHHRAWQKEWMESYFIGWINALPFKDEWSKVIFIAGNHDLKFESCRREDIESDIISKCNGRLVYLQNEYYEFEHFDGEEIKFYSIFGTPYCKIFGNWAFMRSPEKLEEYFSKIPYDLDFLITHDPPNINDVGTILQQTRWSDCTKQVGNEILTKYILDRKPKYIFSGHIHSGNHTLEEYTDGCKIANVSLMNEHYNPIYQPLILNV